ncbi:GDA1/CD39 nucleoside phosphatase family protein (macronuclear) [Tetrahymena thermophila SB210]|uniref:GDA1/CD39 nucleoside phosphatase family protein n=1 Tax=Tetrahymena thermophila (strain SB210) TaxID=312017 RepID=I7LXH7_TETTS|nr:GDA1/CD39 nucleoside phosphatase family protein [Tetrahymena thermophila SB210]EAS04666.2 GDA1/CD39 nucleoside phosphatase family protein [Tetrahymena thermophila SB210]|eukprot:XP_001024911.2 GDA1/CD39 nucleoside phosphatase family protein [Tetrahymena thermophila SB210]
MMKMKSSTILILLCLSIQMFVCKNETFDRNQRILRELAETQDTCLYVLLDAGSSSTKIRLYKSVCRRSSQIPQLEALTPKNNKGKDLYPDIIQVGDNKKNALTKVELNETAFTNYFNVAFEIIKNMKQFYKFDIKPFLFLRATAGVRKLPQQQQEKILNLVRTVFRKQDSFYFLDDSWAKVITGEEEGLFLWISVNYAYQNIKHQNNQQFDIQKTAAVIDVGGVSAQTAFHSTQNNKLIDLPEKTRVQIYSNTDLGYGNDAILESLLESTDSASCFQTTNGFSGKVKNKHDVEVEVTGNYDFVKCTNALLNIMEITNCSYQNDNSVIDCSQFSKMQKLTNQKQIIATSSVFYAKQNVYQMLNLQGDSFKLKEFREQIKQYCSTPLKNEEILADNRKFTSCLQMMWVSTFLIDGLGLLNNEVTAIKKYNTYNIDWSLGSLIYDINTLQCDYLDMNQCIDRITINDISNKEIEDNNAFSSSLIINSFFSLFILVIANLFV